MDPAKVLFEDATRESNQNIVVDKLREIVEKYPESPLAIESLYIIAEQEYLKEDYAQAYREFQTLIEKFRRNKYSSLAWYRRASCLFAVCEYDEAIKEFRQSISLNPWGEQCSLAKIGIADAYFAKNDYHRALREYKSISGGPFHQYILYKITLCHQNLHNEREFKMSKEELIKKYPLSVESMLIANATELNLATDESLKVPLEAVWTIQVGSFTREENARNLSATLRKKGYISWIQRVKIGEGFFYRVYLGKFKTEEEVKRKAEEVNRKEDLPTRIVELK